MSAAEEHAEPAEFERRHWLIAARERSGRSQESLGHDLGVAARTVANWERGRTVPKIEMRIPLAESLGFTLDELNRRLGLPCASDPAELNGNGQVDPLTRVTEWLSLFVRAEQSAYAIWTLETHAFPALCQTAGYARAIELTGHRQFTPEQIEHLVKTRMARAAVLDSAGYTALVPAHLLDVNKGGPDVMAEQLAHLLDLTDRPNVTLLVVDAEHITAAPASFTLLATAGPTPDIASEIGVNGSRNDEGLAATGEHVRLFDHLTSLALDPEASRNAIARAQSRFAAMATTLQRGTTTT